MRYPSDLTDAQWRIISRMLPRPKPGGRPRTTDVRAVVNAIFYVLRSGCAWRMLPHDFPPYQTVYYYFRRWGEDGTWRKIHETLRRRLRRKSGRKRNPSAGSLDSQTVKTTESGGPRGYDAGKKTKGRKRHILVDTMGLLLECVVHPGDVQDRDGGELVLKKLGMPSLKKIWADGAYSGKLVDWAKRVLNKVLEIVKRSDSATGFELLPRRWVVERTFAWLGRYRRLSKDYEAYTSTSETMILLAMIRLMTVRLGTL